MFIHQGSFHGTTPQSANTMNQVRTDTPLKNPLQKEGYNIYDKIATANIIVTESCIPPISQ